ncbi:hypothetical protein [Kocuria rosea]|uniref:hypothetical protein n=1 Tax=Kocuria rosea TaxID=1275 RepID=UPI00126A1EFB|nr:hypothetical protein [Kocuria polaris]
MRAALGSSEIDPGDNFPSDNPVESHMTDVCGKMKAQLSGSGFLIDPKDPSPIKMVPEEGLAEWGWFITADKAGSQTLVLRLWVPGPEEEFIDLGPVYRNNVTVERDWGYVIQKYLPYWLPAVIAAFLAALGFLYRAKRHKT